MTVQITGNHQAVDLRAGDTLVVTAWNSVGGQTLAVRGRRRAVSGSLVDFEGSLLPTADRLASQLTIALDAGTLVSVVVSTAVATQRGQTFVRIAIVDSAGNQRTVLAQDYVTPGAALAWPGGRIASPTEGPGAIRSISGTDPPPGNPISETVPTNTRWRLISLSVPWTADATVVNRRVVITLDNGANQFYRFSAGSLQAATESKTYIAASAGTEHADRAGAIVLLLPDPCLLYNGFRIRMDAIGAQAGDNWGRPELLIEEWINV
jgi:hypothetical protein